MLPADIARLVRLGPPSLAPDGRHAVVAATRADLGADEYRSSLWSVPTDGTAARRLTHGDHDSAPVHSPDGATIAFLRASGTDKPQLHLLPVDGGDARAVTDLPGGAGEPVWSPDSTRIAFAARVPDAGRYGQDDDVPAEKEPPRRITAVNYRDDGTGFVLDRRTHVFVLDVTADEPTPVMITDGPQDDTGPAWSPDGTRLSFVSRRHEAPGHDRITDVHVVAPDGSDVRTLTDSSLWIEVATWTPDGSTVVFSAADPVGNGVGWLCSNEGLWRVAADATGGVPVRLTDAETVQLADVRPVVDGDHVLILAENRGAVELLAVALDGSTRTVSTGPRQLTGLAVAAGTTVVTYSDLSTGGELARLDDGVPVTLTSFGADVASDLAVTEELTATAPDGYPVHGWLALPSGPGPHPVLLMIHGGPFAAYGWTLLDEAQVYARAGYAVVYGNPRGSSGYGAAHGQYILGDVGEKSAPDLYTLLDAALTRPELDPTRVGVLGGSHGGYMTTWIVGHTDRFRAAVSERAVNAVDSFEGTSDIGWDFGDNLYGTDPEQRRRQSPLTYADDISTPLLIIHSEQDWRCPLEQAQRLFVTLRKRNAEVEMLLFPGEGHELSRSGTPRHRVARFEAILDWFGRYV